MRVKFKKQISSRKFFRTMRVAREQSLTGYQIFTHCKKKGNIVTHRYMEFYYQGFLYRFVQNFYKDLPDHEKFYRYNLKELK